MKSVLVTGAHGFLGRNVAKVFNQAGYKVYGLGFGIWQGGELADFGIHHWCETAVTVETLVAMNCRPDVLVHCAGSGSVGFSLDNTYEDFNMTVATTAAVLEYLRVAAPEARLIYPSSAAVYGCLHRDPISEFAPLAPVSPYGVHKLVAEQLCLSASRNFGADCRIIRFFSLYGSGLRKQLLWDASRRLLELGNKNMDFFGSGTETRDWLHVRDAAALILTIAEHIEPPEIVNGASGKCHSVKFVLESLKDAIGSLATITFNGQVREGDPKHLEANMSLVEQVGWQAEVMFEAGLKEYVEWFKVQ